MLKLLRLPDTMIGDKLLLEYIALWIPGFYAIISDLETVNGLGIFLKSTVSTPPHIL